MTTTNNILAAAQRHGPVAVDRIERAIALACEMHRGTLRRNGDPYIVHPLAVAEIVAELGAEPDTIVAALLHDVVDDTDYPLHDIRAEFGPTVAEIVQECMELSHVRLDLAHADRHIHELSRSDYRAVTLKLADRLHNMQTIGCLTEDKQYLKATETAHVIAPLARMVGLDEIASQLDELSIRTLQRPALATSASTPEPWTVELELRHARTLLRLVAHLLMPRSSRARRLAEWDGEIEALTDRRERFRFTVDLVLGLPRIALAAHRSPLAKNLCEDTR